VFIVVAIETEQFPVAAVRRIVVVVMVLVMDRELSDFFPREFPPAPRTDRRVQLECLVPIGLLPEFAIVPRFCDDPLRFVVLWLRVLY
jgi:hypothetical protein